MPIQLDASLQPAHCRAARDVYKRFLALSFRVGKRSRSRLLNWFRPWAEWPGHDAHWDSLEEYAQWLPQHVRWKADSLNGLIDVFPTRATIAAQFKEKGIFEDDCDGLAYFSAQNLPLFVEDPSKVYIVTLIMDPYSFEKDALLYAAHVITVFLHEGDWRVISNATLYPEHFDSFAQAVQGNAYTASHPVLWAEARDKDLNLIASDSDLAKLEAKL
jgi:hypothetical protein